MNEPIANMAPDIHGEMKRRELEKSAQERFDLWSAMGCPTVLSHMAEGEYERKYTGRIIVTGIASLREVQMGLKLVFCPSCMEQDKQMMTRATGLFIKIDDDVASTFAALGHFACHRCGFAEYHPLKRDPRKPDTQADMSEADARIRKLMAEMDYLRRGRERYMDAKKIYEQYVNPPVPSPPIPGMLKNEYEALIRQWTQAQQRARQALNPDGIGLPPTPANRGMGKR